ncbi:MAG: hypothetical protein RLZZ293_298 [Pseudomonadota bacterium]|jgi:hypothetical protein
MQNNPLADLKDIQLPQPVSIFPLAYGWYGIITILILAILIGGYYYYRLVKHRQYQNNLLSLVTQIEQQLVANPQDTTILSKISILLKQIARSKFANETPQNLYGQAWLEFLDRTGKTQEFTLGVGKILLDVYQNKPLVANEEFFLLIRKWIRSVI